MTRTTVAAVGGTNMNADHNIVELEAEVTRLRTVIDRLHRILAALREPSEAVGDAAYDAFVKGRFFMPWAIRAAVEAVEQEVGRE